MNNNRIGSLNVFGIAASIYEALLLIRYIEEPFGLSLNRLVEKVTEICNIQEIKTSEEEIKEVLSALLNPGFLFSPKRGYYDRLLHSSQDDKYLLYSRTLNKFNDEINQLEITSYNGKEFVKKNCKIGLISLDDRNKTLSIFVHGGNTHGDK